MTQTQDDPIAVMKHANLYKGGKALVILGGASARAWRDVYEDIKPDVTLGANGVINAVTDLDYWMLAENMTRTSHLAADGDVRSQQFMAMMDKPAKVRLISHHSWHLVANKSNAISIRRQGYDTIPDTFTLREYGQGYLSGWILKQQGVGTRVRVGTVGLQLMHHASLLGCAEVHTIGYDLCFKEGSHHFYEYPKYQPDRFRTKDMFVSYEGYNTQHFWIETAQYLKQQLAPQLVKDAVVWNDHSNGLLDVI